MNVYLAARYSRRLEMADYAEELKTHGHTIASTWIDGHHKTRPGIDANGTDEEKSVWAVEDLSDLFNANTYLIFTHHPNGNGRERGGYRVEMGVALGRMLFGSRTDATIHVIGPRVNVFDCLDLGDAENLWAYPLSFDGRARRYRWWPTWDAFREGVL